MIQITKVEKEKRSCFSLHIILFCAYLLNVFIAFKLLDILWRAREKGQPLMQLCHGYPKDVGRPVATLSSRLRITGKGKYTRFYIHSLSNEFERWSQWGVTIFLDQCGEWFPLPVCHDESWYQLKHGLQV